MKLAFWRRDPEVEIEELRWTLRKVDLSDKDVLYYEKRLRKLSPNDPWFADDEFDDGLGGGEYQPQMRKITMVAPSLNGRLIVKPSADGFDLHWPSSNKPTFRYFPDENEIHLARKFKSSDGNSNVSVLFDLAREKGFGVPAIVIFGNDEFKRAAAREAAKRGLLVEGDEVVMRAYNLAREEFVQLPGREENGLGTTHVDLQHKHMRL